MIELSFVIPAYNVEKYIERCLNSIFSQNVDESLYEVIVIDDGSTDNTLELLNREAKKHGNLHVITQENQGPSVARNNGIELSKGKYIWFVDSDDYIVEGSALKILELTSQYLMDILYFTYNEVDMDGCLKNGGKQPVTKNKLLSGKQALKEGFYPTSVCLALWNRDYLWRHSIQFNSDIMYAEDSLFSFQALVQSHKIMFVDDAYYIYEKREGSSTTKTDKEKILKQKMSDIFVSKKIMDMAFEIMGKDAELSQLMENQAKKMIFGLTYEIFRNRREWKKKGISPLLLNEMEKRGMYPLKKPYGSFPKAVLAFVLNQKIVLL